ncbi:hypothetical protein SORBI_3001G255500 [Sorghum bicolor]|uniref:Uncharacterized protein n=1 Tax=Sorghum bicolor TaxID=4558 RepID=A0A1B6QL05_SORBI|nr:hypothetical protein SORBI_3001G255500 [Sorghum bicolor]
MFTLLEYMIFSFFYIFSLVYVSKADVWVAAALGVERCGQQRFPGGGSTPLVVDTDGHTMNYLLEDKFNVWLNHGGIGWQLKFWRSRMGEPNERRISTVCAYVIQCAYQKG